MPAKAKRAKAEVVVEKCLKMAALWDEYGRNGKR